MFYLLDSIPAVVNIAQTPVESGRLTGKVGIASLQQYIRKR